MKSYINTKMAKDNKELVAIEIEAQKKSETGVVPIQEIPREEKSAADRDMEMDFIKPVKFFNYYFLTKSIMH